MKLCFLADVRSPIARNWISFFPDRGHEVSVISTSPNTADPLPGVDLHFLPWRLNALSTAVKGNKHGENIGLPAIDPSKGAGKLMFYTWEALVLPIKCVSLSGAAKKIVRQIAPDLLHALRIPIEGELAGMTQFSPYVLSVWGNDFTLFADQSALHRYFTRKALVNASGLLADSNADLARANLLGLRPNM